MSGDEIDQAIDNFFGGVQDSESDDSSSETGSEEASSEDETPSEEEEEEPKHPELVPSSEDDEKEPIPNGLVRGVKRKRKPLKGVLDGGSVKRLRYRAGVERAGEDFNKAVRSLIDARLEATISRSYVHMRKARGRLTLRKEDVHAALRTMGEVMAS